MKHCPVLRSGALGVAVNLGGLAGVLRAHMKGCDTPHLAVLQVQQLHQLQAQLEVQAGPDWSSGFACELEAAEDNKALLLVFCPSLVFLESGTCLAM